MSFNLQISSMKNKLFFLAICCFAFFSCKKNDSSSQNNNNKTSFLVQQSWKFNNAGLDPDKNGTIDLDVSSQIPACLTDNSVTFSVGNTGVSDEGSTKCNTSDPQTVPFGWSFTNNETMISINGNAIAGKGGEFKIITLNGTQFTLSKDTILLGTQTAFIVNLKH